MPIAALALLAACAEMHAKMESSHAAPLARPPVEAGKPVNLPGLHNVVSYSPTVMSGSVPDGEQGLATLAALGVKTVVSVDGAAPDVATAERLGLHYIHLPISYDRVPAERRREYAQVIENADGPIYMHCHHGKHRSAAATATAMVTAGVMSEPEAEARMKVSGTSPSYEGLWQSLRECQPLPANELVADLGDAREFPSLAKVTGMVSTMSQLDVAYDDLKAAHDANWQVPKDHPDLVPTNTTDQIHRLFAGLLDEPESQQLPAGYQELLRQEITRAKQLDEALRAGNLELASQHFDAVAKGCKSCHAQFRDK
ncbi:MAG: cytochrome c [Planctomycetes bacterium]|nr:cytochrome c [Planctomycetota bacterium]